MGMRLVRSVIEFLIMLLDSFSVFSISQVYILELGVTYHNNLLVKKEK